MCWDVNLGARAASNALASCGHDFSKTWVPAVLGIMMFAHLSPLVEGSKKKPVPFHGGIKTMLA